MAHLHQIAAFAGACALWAACGGTPQSGDAVGSSSEPKPIGTTLKLSTEKSPLPSCDGKPWGHYGAMPEDEPMMSALRDFYKLRGEPVTSLHADEMGPNRSVDVRINFSSENVVVHRLTPRQEDGKWLFDIDWACQLVGGTPGPSTPR